LPRFVYLFFQSSAYWLQIETSKRGIGQPNVNGRVLSQIEIPLPPLDEQRRIVAELDTQLTRLDANVTALKRVQANLKRYRASVLKDACEGRLVPTEAELGRREGRQTENSSIELQRIKSSVGMAKIRRGVPDPVPLSPFAQTLTVPDGWTINSIAELLRGGAFLDVKDGNHGTNHPRRRDFTTAGLPFITATEVGGFRIDFQGAPKVSGEPLAKLRVGFAIPGDVILTHKGTVGRVAICAHECVLSPQTTYYRIAKGAFDRRYLLYFFASPQFYRQLTDVKSQTTRDYVPISDQ
jgi:type I restriction enzyme S subunit